MGTFIYCFPRRKLLIDLTNGAGGWPQISFHPGVLGGMTCATFVPVLFICTCCGANFPWFNLFSNQFDFYFPLFQIIIINTRQIEIK